MTMSFVEFVIRRLVGPPRGENPRGDSYLPCPFRTHSNGQYHVLVNRPELDHNGHPIPIKARCMRGCGPGPKGCFDAKDVVWAVHRSATPKENETTWLQLHAEWEGGADPDVSSPPTGHTGPQRDTPPGPGEVVRTYQALTDVERNALAVAMEIARTHLPHYPEGLLWYAWNSVGVPPDVLLKRLTSGGSHQPPRPKLKASTPGGN